MKMSLLLLEVEHDGKKERFGTVRDLEIYMRLEGVQEVTLTTKYIFEPVVPKMKLTYAEVKALVESEKKS